MEKQGSELWKSVGQRHWLVAAWQEGFRRAVEALAPPGEFSGVRFSPAIADAAVWMSWPAPNWFRLGLESLPRASVTAGCPQQTVQMLARLIAGDQTLPQTECEAAFQELVGQTASATADTISARLGKKVSFSAAQVSGAPADPDYAVQIDFSFGGAMHTMAFSPDAELMEAIEAVAEAAESPKPPPSSPPAGAAGNLDLLLEVELPVCVTFGRTQLLLKDVLKLSSGSIVELNRLVNEPVEVVINNSVIARGEVVVVDGNYGVRVTEIVSRQERIRSVL